MDVPGVRIDLELCPIPLNIASGFADVVAVLHGGNKVWSAAICVKLVQCSFEVDDECTLSTTPADRRTLQRRCREVVKQG